MRSAVVVLGVMLVGSSSAAQGVSPREAFDQGLAAFQARDYATALQRFERAYALSHSPEFLFNIGLTLERLERRADAITALQQYLTLRPSSPQRAVVERHIADLRAALAAATPAPVVAPPPPPLPVVTPPPPSPSLPPPPPPSVSRPVWPWVVLGVGVASGATGAVLLATATDPGGDPDVRTESQYVDATGALETRRIVAGVLLGVGGAATVAGLVGALVGRASRESAAPRAFVWPTAGGGVVGVSGRF